ncbi:MAG TPA: anti-sigma factor, partial [Gaiellaceae bacterium]|nr:anti-sigma factor [Gaiellaceae bacterium]
ALAAGRGRLVVDPSGRAALLVHGLEPAPAGKTYEAWIVEDGTPRPAGLFRGEATVDVVLVEGTVPAGAVVAVTLEDGPVERPTSKPVVASQPA